MYLNLLGRKVIVLDFDVELGDMFNEECVWDWEVEIDLGSPVSRSELFDDDKTVELAAAIDAACIEEEKARAEDRHMNRNSPRD